VPSGHDLGKSFLAAAVACQWIDEHEVGEAFVVSTAPTSPQVTAILWREIERMHRRLSLSGQINMGRVPEWKIGKELVGYGRKPADYDESGFQGIHCRYPLILVDEAAGIPEQLWTAVDALATNENARVLAIGNPDDTNSPFRTMCLPGSGWSVVRLDGLTCPNMSEDEVKHVSNIEGETGDLWQYMVDNKIPFSDEKIPFELREVLLAPRWVAERMISWGVYKDDDGVWQESPLWESRVRAVFPQDQTGAGVIPLPWIEKAVERWEEYQRSGIPETELVGSHVFGCDVARFGEDETAMSERVGRVVLKVERVGQQDTQTTALRLARRMSQHGNPIAVVDVIGVGAGVVDRLREEGHEVIGFNSAAKTDMMDGQGEFSFPNLRSAAWWNVREMLDPSKTTSIGLALPPDEQLIADLVAPRWKVLSGARIQVEPKEETKKRLRRSPDSADAVVMSLFYLGIDMGTPYVAEYSATTSQYVHTWSNDIFDEPTFRSDDYVFSGFEAP